MIGEQIGTIGTNHGHYYAHLHLEIDVPYATYVDYYKPYLSELEDNLIENIIENVEMEWSLL